MPKAPGISDRPVGEETILAQVQRWQDTDTVIDNATARAIAQLYHGPNWTETTQLGQGTPFDPDELLEEIEFAHMPDQPDDDTLGRPALRALIAWVNDYQLRISA